MCTNIHHLKDCYTNFHVSIQKFTNRNKCYSQKEQSNVNYLRFRVTDRESVQISNDNLKQNTFTIFDKHETTTS